MSSTACLDAFITVARADRRPSTVSPRDVQPIPSQPAYGPDQGLADSVREPLRDSVNEIESKLIDAASQAADQTQAKAAHVKDSIS